MGSDPARLSSVHAMSGTTLSGKFIGRQTSQMHYDSLTLDGIQYSLNLSEPSGPTPLGWTDNLGVQWQLDTASTPLAFNEWIDNVKLTIR